MNLFNRLFQTSLPNLRNLNGFLEPSRLQCNSKIKWPNSNLKTWWCLIQAWTHPSRPTTSRLFPPSTTLRTRYSRPRYTLWATRAHLTSQTDSIQERIHTLMWTGVGGPRIWHLIHRGVSRSIQCNIKCINIKTRWYIAIIRRDTRLLTSHLVM